MTLLVLALGLPAVGDAVGIYQLNWSASGQAYASVEGACGRIDVSPPGEIRRFTFCFGETVNAVSSDAGGRGAAWRDNLVVGEFRCDGTGEDAQCQQGIWAARGPDVTWSIDPLLTTATVQATLGDEWSPCGAVDLTLTAASEPNLRAEPWLEQPHIGVGPDGGHNHIGFGGADSVGRDALVSGTLCDAAVQTEGYDLWRGRIFRGLGSEGVRVEVNYS